MISVHEMKRIGLGVAAASGALVVISILGTRFRPSSSDSSPDKLLQTFYVMPPAAMLGSAAAMFVAALAGTRVARRNFVAPAACLSLALWLFIIYNVHSIAAVADQGDLFGIATQNSLLLLPSLAGALAGAIVGQRLFRHRWGDEQGGPA